MCVHPWVHRQSLIKGRPNKPGGPSQPELHCLRKTGTPARLDLEVAKAMCLRKSINKENARTQEYPYEVRPPSGPLGKVTPAPTRTVWGGWGVGWGWGDAGNELFFLQRNNVTGPLS